MLIYHTIRDSNSTNSPLDHIQKFIKMEYIHRQEDWSKNWNYAYTDKLFPVKYCSVKDFGDFDNS